MLTYDFGKRAKPCSDCDERGHCTMNCSQASHIDHSKPVVYEFQDLTTGDVLVFDDHASANRQMHRADPKHLCRIVCRNVHA